MADIDPIVVQIKAEFGDLRKDLADVKKQLKGFTNETKKADDAGKGFKGTNDGILLGIKRLRADLGATTFAITSMTGGMTLLIKSQTDAFKETKRWAGMLDISAESLSSLAVVGKRFNVTLDDVASGISDMSLKITDAANGANSFEEILNKIGLSSRDLVKMKPDEQFLKLADAISGANSELRRFVLDELGSDPLLRMIGLLETGSSGIKAMVKDVKTLGQSLSSDDLKKMDELSASITEANIALDATAKAFTIKIGPALVKTLELTDQVLTGWGMIADVFRGGEDDLAELRKESDKVADSLERAKKSLGIAQGGGKLSFFESAEEATKRLQKETAMLSIEYQNIQNRISEMTAPATQSLDDQIVRTEKLLDLNRAFSDMMSQGGGLSLSTFKDDSGMLPEDNGPPSMFPMPEEEKEIKDLLLEQLLDFQENEFTYKSDQRTREEEAQKAFMDREFGDAKRQIDRLKSLEKSGWQGRFKMGMEFTQNIAAALDDGSRKSFERTKKLNMAEAVINTIGGVTKALNNPYPVNLLFAASVAAAGAAQIAKISSSSYGGGSGGGAAGVPEAVSAPEAAQAQTVSNFDVTLQGDNFGGDGIRSLIAQINGELDDGATIGRIGVR